jgi:hypothetical protein
MLEKPVVAQLLEQFPTFCVGESFNLVSNEELVEAVTLLTCILKLIDRIFWSYFSQSLKENADTTCGQSRFLLHLSTSFCLSEIIRF